MKKIRANCKEREHANDHYLTGVADFLSSRPQEILSPNISRGAMHEVMKRTSFVLCVS